MIIEPLDAETRRYIAAFDIAAIVITGKNTAHIAVTRRPPSKPRSLWWAQAPVAVRIVEEVARSLPCDVVTAGQLVEQTALRLRVRLTQHSVLVARTRARVEELAKRVERARASGELQTFNREFARRRKEARAAGKPFMSYGHALTRLRTALARDVAGGQMVILENIFGDAG